MHQHADLIDWFSLARTERGRRERQRIYAPRPARPLVVEATVTDASGLGLGSLLQTTTNWYGVPVGTVGRLVAEDDGGWIVAWAHGRQSIWMPTLFEVRPWAGEDHRAWQALSLAAVGDSRWLLNPKRRPQLWTEVSDD